MFQDLSRIIDHQLYFATQQALAEIRRHSRGSNVESEKDGDDGEGGTSTLLESRPVPRGVDQPPTPTKLPIRTGPKQPTERDSGEKIEEGPDRGPQDGRGSEKPNSSGDQVKAASKANSQRLRFGDMNKFVRSGGEFLGNGPRGGRGQPGPAEKERWILSRRLESPPAEHPGSRPAHGEEDEDIYGATPPASPTKTQHPQDSQRTREPQRPREPPPRPPPPPQDPRLGRPPHKQPLKQLSTQGPSSQKPASQKLLPQKLPLQEPLSQKLLPQKPLSHEPPSQEPTPKRLLPQRPLPQQPPQQPPQSNDKATCPPHTSPSVPPEPSLLATIASLTILCEDVPQLFGFYQRVFDAAVVAAPSADETTGSLVFNRGSLRLTLLDSDVARRQRLFGPGVHLSRSWDQGRRSMLGVRVADVDVVYAKLQAVHEDKNHRVEGLTSPRNRPEGGRMLTFCDVAGHCWMVWQEM